MAKAQRDVTTVALDTSVWLNYLTEGKNEKDDADWLAHSISVVEHAERGDLQVVLPTLVIAELAGAGSVRGHHLPYAVRRARIERVREWMTVTATFRIVELHERVAQVAADLAMEHQLRGGDAVMLATSIVAKCPFFLSWDKDHLKLCGVRDLGTQVMSPADFAAHHERDLLDEIP